LRNYRQTEETRTAEYTSITGIVFYLINNKHGKFTKLTKLR